jgi:hypothetical protein
MPNYSEGVRTGELVKISRKGIIWESWEGELLMSDFRFQRRDVGGGANVWCFSTRDDELGRELGLAVGGKVKIHYRQWLISPPTQDTSYNVTKIEILP